MNSSLLSDLLLDMLGKGKMKNYFHYNTEVSYCRIIVSLENNRRNFQREASKWDF